MSTTIKVTGFKTPRILKPRRRTRRRVAYVTSRNLIWVWTLVAMAVTIEVWGTPHLLMTDRAAGSIDFPFYRDCAYVGLHGRTISPPDGRCPLIRLLKANGA